MVVPGLIKTGENLDRSGDLRARADFRKNTDKLKCLRAVIVEDPAQRSH